MTETEATLVVVSERPAELLGEIESFTSIGPYRLGPSRVLKFDDRYFDTADRALTKNKWALRLRNIGSETRIALKGPSRNKDLGAVERLEIDFPSDPESLSKIFSEMVNRKLGAMLPKTEALSVDSLKTLKLAGLQVIQHRTTRRRLKNVLVEQTGDLLAELALDSVVYLLAQGEVAHFEIEIEAKANDGCNTIRTVSEFLRRLYGSQLLPWPHSKLVTGDAIEILVEQMRLGDPLQAVRLTSGDYKMIDDYINSHL